ncbi:hypothetical protein DKT77_12315 [Meridianimarinicoccus roseus]|uniref:PEP-CTERM protein-sorting domain-containing protein n=1 Tax=Meridianimarinicoccus roseus TaxID=2072018 RepID=A0A2V2LA82_9RHOB|nr:hypothetical protein [Meridianimarinicoccus roseus]PWR02328.1 hypothetical protein DKT77_12315 [Meridianimarinicoccus roseus]
MKSLALTLGLTAFLAVQAQAVTLAAVLDYTTQDTRFINATEAVAISFSLSDATSAISVSAPIDCAACEGEVFLTNDVGTGSSLANLVDWFALENITGSELFSGLSLPSGTYYLGVSVTSGFATWGESGTPTVIENSPGDIGLQYAASPILAGFPASSDFIARLSGDALLFEVETTAIPAPASVLLLISAAGGLMALGRRRSSGA